MNQSNVEKTITLDDKLEHCINSLMSIVKYTYSFENEPGKKDRQLKRNIEARNKAKATLEALIASEKIKLLREIYGKSGYWVDGISEMETFVINTMVDLEATLTQEKNK